MGNKKRRSYVLAFVVFTLFGIYTGYIRWQGSADQKAVWKKTSEYARNLIEFNKKDGIKIIYENDIVDAAFEVPLSYIREYQKAIGQNIAVFGYPKYFAYHKEEVPVMFYHIFLEEMLQEGKTVIIKNRNFEEQFLENKEDISWIEYQKQWLEDIASDIKDQTVILLEVDAITEEKNMQIKELEQIFDPEVNLGVQFSLRNKPDSTLLQKFNDDERVGMILLEINNIDEEQNISIWKENMTKNIILTTSWREQTKEPEEWREYIELIAKKYSIENLLWENTCSFWTQKESIESAKDLDICHKNAKEL